MTNDLEDRLERIPGIGPKLTRRILNLGITDAETLRMVAEAGRLERLKA